MKCYYKTLIMQIVFISLIICNYAQMAESDFETSKYIMDSRTSKFKKELEKRGFIVQEGTLERTDLIDLYCDGISPDCAGNNAGSLYMTYRIPPNPWASLIFSMPILFQLDKDEALVLIGKTPPPVVYFSYQTFMQQRYYNDIKNYKRIFSPVGDTINNMTIRTKNSKNHYNSRLIIINAADKGIAKSVRSAALAADFSSKYINYEIIPSSIFKMGNLPGDDLFSFGHRLYLPKTGYEQDVEDYLNTPQLVFRITPSKPIEKPNLYPAPNLRVRGNGKTEMELIPALEELRKAILEKYKDYEATELTTFVGLTDGYDGLQRNVDIWGPTRDALYLETTPYFNLPENSDDFLIVYGINHDTTQKTLYSSFVFYVSEEIRCGINGINSKEYYGSAADYVPNHPKVNNLYTWKVIRKETHEPHCLNIKVETCDKINWDDNTNCFFWFRLYMEPTTKIGPAFTEVVYDRVIKFTKK